MYPPELNYAHGAPYSRLYGPTYPTFPGVPLFPATHLSGPLSSVVSSNYPGGAYSSNFLGYSFVDERYEGVLENRFDGNLDGRFEGNLENRFDANLDGRFESALEGRFEGGLEGSFNGALEGRFDGSLEGSFQGSLEGSFQGGLESGQENLEDENSLAEGALRNGDLAAEESRGKSAAIDIRPNKVWKRGGHAGLESQNRPKNLGKVTINMDTNLSSSTDELLKLAGGGPLQKMRVILPSYEDSPPSTPETVQLVRSKVSRKEMESVQCASNQNSEQITDQLNEDYNQILRGFQHVSISPGPVLPISSQASLTPITLPAQAPLVGGSLTESQVGIPARPQTQICRYFAGGFCTQGERCNYAHIEHLTGAPVPAVPAGLPTGGPPVPVAQPPGPSGVPSLSVGGPAIVHKTRFKNGRIPIPASQYANLKLENCIGEIAQMCLDQHGCRYLQRQLDTGDPQVIKMIFDEVIDHIVSLMSDPFGNYLCQKLIEHCSDEQRVQIVKGVAGDIVHISKNMHGTRAVQKLIEHLSSSEENKLIRKALKGSVVGLIQDLNGNHVIQKCLHKMEPNDNQFIYDAVAQHCVQVSTHRHGCCVMQRCIDHATYHQKLQLVKEIKCAALSLVQDAFGNYVVQYALDLDIPNLATELIAELHTKLLYLARQKFSSNVVEKCLKVGTALCVIRVLRELMEEDPNPENPNPIPSPHPEIIQQNLVELLQDSYGNYVIQTCLSEGAIKAPKEYQRMVNLLNPYVHQLRNAPYIKRIQNLLSLPTKNHVENGNSDNNQHIGNVIVNSDLGNRGVRDPRNSRPNLYFTNNSRFQRQ